MQRDFTVSLCISTYNFPKALALCLESILSQSFLPSEIIIGDDGSTDETGAVIDQYKKKFPMPVKHIWHPDEGFRLAAIRNKSFAAATGDYIIQIDGDLVLHRHFIADHCRFAKPDIFVAGTRSLLNEIDTSKLFASGRISDVHHFQLEKSYNAKRILPLAHLVFAIQKGASQVKYVLGANMAFWKKDLLKVNGYNESFTGWGKEDNDISIRLSNAGVELHFLRFAAIIYHLYHKNASAEKLHDNEILMMQAAREKLTFVDHGISQHLT